MLDHSGAVRYLLERRYLAVTSLVDGELKVIDCSRRNRNFKVISDQGPSYLLKQGVGPDGRATVAHEARVYRLLHARPAGRDVADYLPRFHQYDDADRVLVLELLGDARDLREYHAHRRAFPARVATKLAQALSAFHRQTRGPSGTGGFGGPSGGTPWILSVHRPGLEIFRETSHANVQLIRIIQQTAGFPEMLDEIRRQWRSDGLIHHDIKWDNCLWHSPSGDGRGAGVKIVDWEFAAPGDACWDAGAVFGAYLGFWLFSIPVTGDQPPERFLELARYPLSRMQPAIRAYWRAYAEGMGLDPVASHEWLLRAVRYAAARLLQTGFEQMQKATELTGNVVCLLQLSLNIMQRPREAIAHLLGIPLPFEPSPRHD